MNTSDPSRPRAKDVWFTRGHMHVELTDGRIIVARADRYRRLARATSAQRNRWELIGKGVGIRWPEIDEDLSTEGLLRDALSVRSARRLAG